jgi:hypothetical protein
MQITPEMLEYSWQRFDALATSLHITIGYQTDPIVSDPKRACEKAVGLDEYSHIADPIERVEAVITTEYVPAYEKRAASEAAG